MNMETSALYQVGWLFSVAVLAIRCISNILDDHGEDKEVKSADPFTAASLAAAALDIFLSHPN